MLSADEPSDFLLLQQPEIHSAEAFGQSLGKLSIPCRSRDSPESLHPFVGQGPTPWGWWLREDEAKGSDAPDRPRAQPVGAEMLCAARSSGAKPTAIMPRCGRFTSMIKSSSALMRNAPAKNSKRSSTCP